MKRYYSILCFSILIGLASCGGDDNDNGPSYKFKDQDAIGKIENVTFAYADGYADVETDNIRITLTLAQPEDICDMFFPEGNTVFFTVDNEAKLSKLFWNMNDGTGQTVTLFEEENFTSIIAAKGAVEILTITETEVTGRIDARVDSETFINGNFSVQRCPQ